MRMKSHQLDAFFTHPEAQELLDAIAEQANVRLAPTYVRQGYVPHREMFRIITEERWKDWWDFTELTGGYWDAWLDRYFRFEPISGFGIPGMKKIHSNFPIFQRKHEEDVARDYLCTILWHDSPDGNTVLRWMLEKLHWGKKDFEDNILAHAGTRGLAMRMKLVRMYDPERESYYHTSFTQEKARNPTGWNNLWKIIEKKENEK
jgi:hypothetical protein